MKKIKVALLLLTFSTLGALAFTNCAGQGFKLREEVLVELAQSQGDNVKIPDRGIVGGKGLDIDSASQKVLNSESMAKLTIEEQIAKAYMTAVTDQTEERSVMTPAGFVDYSSCSSALRWSEACQKSVYNGKDGKTLLMEVLNDQNIFALISPESARRANGMDLFANITGPNNGWYEYNQTVKNNKLLLKTFLSRVDSYRNSYQAGERSPGNLTYFDGIPDSRITQLAIDFKIDEFPQFYARDALYFWALTIYFTAADPGLPTYWGHIGLQISDACGSATGKCANWGGGGQADGGGDYGAGGSHTKPFEWKKGVNYTFYIFRGPLLPGTTKAYAWYGFILDPVNQYALHLGAIVGGEYVVNGLNRNDMPVPHVMTETGYGVKCDSAQVAVTWGRLVTLGDKLAFADKAQAYDGGQFCRSKQNQEQTTINSPYFGLLGGFSHKLGSPNVTNSNQLFQF
jgi:hypothetical protein